ncbi:phosphate ion transmembrane transporter [Aureococcus anophagefferens]|uniref:Phosphate ion transmembrane transporter n=1 Tax=Aureococcus anophagefferens TaxID=44056 RepID=A0ABR1GB93_AURAN
MRVPGPFVNYLSRFLLSYDEGSRAFWRAGSAEIPIAWDEQKVRRKRATRFANYAASVGRAGLCVYAEKSTTAAGDYSATPQLGVRQLLSLLKSRYGLLPDAQRQLSLLFSLLDPPLQPSEAIASLAARYENATVAAVDVRAAGGGKAARLGAPRFAPTGRILGFIVTEAGCGYGAPPDVTVSAPAATAASRGQRLAVVDDKGRLRGVELVDGGVGYVPSGPENDLTRCEAVGCRAFFADPVRDGRRELELSLASSFGAVLVAAALVAPLEAAKAPGVAGVTIFCARAAGAAGALLSTPADAVVTELATGKHGSDWTKALAAITGAEGEAEALGGPRAVSPENLSLGLDVFADRLSFYGITTNESTGPSPF